MTGYQFLQREISLLRWFNLKPKFGSLENTFLHFLVERWKKAPIEHQVAIILLK